MAVKKTSKKKAAAKKVSSKKPARKTSAKKSAPKKAVQKKVTAKKATVKKTAVKKTATKKAAVKKTVVKDKKLTLREKKILDIRAKLVGQKEELLQEAESAMNALPEQTVFPDLGDQATAETDRNFMLKLKGREQRLLNKIDEAIEKIDSGNYGTCESCGENIKTPRLDARPVTSLCIECKTEQEEEERLQRS